MCAPQLFSTSTEWWGQKISATTGMTLKSTSSRGSRLSESYLLWQILQKHTKFKYLTSLLHSWMRMAKAWMSCLLSGLTKSYLQLTRLAHSPTSSKFKELTLRKAPSTHLRWLWGKKRSRCSKCREISSKRLSILRKVAAQPPEKKNTSWFSFSRTTSSSVWSTKRQTSF